MTPTTLPDTLPKPAAPVRIGYARATSDHDVGRVIAGRYLLLRVIGMGGMGRVYEAAHTITQRRVALKLLHVGSAEAAARFLQEAQAPSSIGHPGLVEVFDAGVDADGTQYLAMELLEGEEFATRIALGVVAPSLLANVACQLLDALEAAHAHGFIHRDIKPENVFLLRDPDGAMRVKLLDFGIARQVDGGGSASVTRTGVVMGTPYYMSPEQARGERVDARTDLWSLGAVMFHALVGAPPFDGDNHNVVVSELLKAEVPSLSALRPDLPLLLRQVVERALRKDPAERWSSASAMRAALVTASNAPPPCVDDAAPVATDERRVEPPRATHGPHAHWRGWGVPVIALVATALGLATLAVGARRHRPVATSATTARPAELIRVAPAPASRPIVAPPPVLAPATTRAGLAPTPSEPRLARSARRARSAAPHASALPAPRVVAAAPGPEAPPATPPIQFAHGYE